MTEIQTQFQHFKDSAQEKSLIYNNVKWQYFVHGNGSNSLVILTGGGSIAEAAFMYTNSFASDFRVITLTIPNITTMAACIEGLNAILASEQIAKTNILGFSMGGMIAQSFVRSFPDKVEKMILFVSMLPSPEYAKKYAKYRKGISIVPEFLFRWISKKSLKKQVLAEQDKASPEVINFWLDFFSWEFDSKKVTKQSLLATTDILIDYFSNYTFTSNDLSNWKGSMLLIESEKDATISVEERVRFKQLYSKAKVVTQHNSGHFGSGLLNPEPVIAEIFNFLHESLQKG